RIEPVPLTTSPAINTLDPDPTCPRVDRLRIRPVGSQPRASYTSTSATPGCPSVLPTWAVNEPGGSPGTIAASLLPRSRGNAPTPIAVSTTEKKGGDSSGSFQSSFTRNGNPPEYSVR